MRASAGGAPAPQRPAARTALQRAELGVLDAGQIELPGGEPLAYLGDRGAQDASLLRRRRGAETEAGRLHFRREPRLAALLGQEPGVPVPGEDDAGQQIARGGDDGRASARVESRNAAAQERPRKRHVARAIT